VGKPRTRAPYKPRWRTRVALQNSATVSAKPARARYSAELIASTKEVWQPYYSKPLTDEDAREIIENIVAFMEVLATIRDDAAVDPSSVQIGPD
jgi:hypothetical protein